MIYSKCILMGTYLFIGALENFAFANSEKVIELKTVQQMIKQSNANWRAQETWVSQLPRSEAKRMMGLKELPKGELDYNSIQPLADDLPRAIDWRNVNGINWIGPIMNQGVCGSCVAFALVGALETQTSIDSGMPWLRPTFSPQALFACGGALCDGGWSPDPALAYMKKNGIPDEACMPYTSGSSGKDVACSTQCTDASQRSSKIAGSYIPSQIFQDPQAVKRALLKGPLVTTMYVYSDFLSYAGGIYTRLSYDLLGAHAVGLIGYDDNKRAWLIRNSWGPLWGENGFAWINYDDDSKLAINTWAIQSNPVKNDLSVYAPIDRDYVSGTIQLISIYLSKKIEDVQFRLKDPEGHLLSPLSCSIQFKEGCYANLNTRGLKEGRYEIYSESSSASAKKSQVREFFVINSKPQMSISLKAAEGIDLSRPLKGNIKFLIHTESFPLPIQQIEFRVINSEGRSVHVKVSDRVLSEMKAGLWTQSIPNGQYQILVQGKTKFQGKSYIVNSNPINVKVSN